MASTSNIIDCKQRFVWDKDEKVDNLICCFANYKSQMEFSNKDFNADKVKMYEEVRKSTVRIYVEKRSFFGQSATGGASPEDAKIGLLINMIAKALQCSVIDMAKNIHKSVAVTSLGRDERFHPGMKCAI